MFKPNPTSPQPRTGDECAIIQLLNIIYMRKINLLLLMLLTVFGSSGAWADDVIFVGNSSDQTTYSNRLVGATATQSYSETVYKKSLLTGLEEGSGIKRIMYKGTYTGDEGSLPLMVWIGNTTDEAPATQQYLADGTTYNYDMADPDELGMTLIYDGNYTVTSPGEDGVVLSFDVPSSFRYTGNNLRIMVAKVEETTLSRALNIYCAKASPSDAALKNTMFRQNSGIFSLTSSPFVWIETGVASDHNFKITANTLPTQATIDVAYEASITVENQGIDEAAGGYTVKYYFDDEEVATATAVALAKGATTTFTFAYTPTTLGRHTSYAEIVFPDGASVKTSKVQMKVEEADPRWSWDFEDNSWPDGCYYTKYQLDSYIHLKDNGYYITPTDNTGSTEALIFITPLLHAKASEPIYFDAAKFYNYTHTDDPLKVMISTDRKTWTTIATFTPSQYTGAQVGGSSSDLWDFVNLSATVPTEGDYYVAFQGQVRLDNFYGLKAVEQAHDLWITEEDLPTTGTANNEVKATLTVMNLFNATETASAKYYINGTVVGEAAQQNLTSRSEKTFTLTCMPHETGTYNSYIELTLADGTTLRSSEVEITIGEEEPKGEATVGTYNSYSSSIPVQTTSTGSYSDMVWSASELQSVGIGEGTAIKGIIFKGYSSSEVTAPVQMWVSNSTATTPVVGSDPTDDMSNTEGMTKVYDGDYTFKKGGTYGAANQVDIMTVMFDEPLVFDGTNLRVHAQCVQSEMQSGVSFAYTNTTGAAYKAKSQWGTGYYGNDSSKLPWITLLFDKEASHLTGTLTIKNADGTVSPIADTKITLTADDGTQYSGTTDSEGQYDITVMQDAKTYAIAFEYTAKTTFPIAEDDKSVNLGGSSKVKDIQLEEGVDFLIESVDAPTTATTNTAYTATVTATNYNATTLAAADYTAILYVDGKAVAEAEKSDVASMEKATFTFSFTPHETGTFSNCYIALAGPTTTVQTEAYELTIAAETAGGEVQVGNENGTSNKSPFYWYDADAAGGVMVDFAYTPAMLAAFDVKANAKITSITFKKANGTSKTFTKESLKIWVALEDANEPFTAGDIDQTKMKKYAIYDDVSANVIDDVVIDMSADPIVYDGTSRIRIYVENNGYGSWGSVTYYYDNNSGGQKAYYKKASASSWTSDSGTPVAYFTLAAATHFTGSVADKGSQPVAGAKVTLTNAENDVVYYATTDEEGLFDVEVIQNDKDYVVTVEAEGFETLEAEGTVNVSEGDSTDNAYVLSSADVLLGDANGDGEVDINDYVTVISYIQEEEPSPFVFENADVNGDGEIDINDYVGIIDIILNEE